MPKTAAICRRTTDEIIQRVPGQWSPDTEVLTPTESTWSIARYSYRG